MTENKKGKALGGKAKNAKMTTEERKEQSRKMIEAREFKKHLPKSLYRGVLTIGNIEIRCDVLNDDMRVLRETDIYSAVGTGTGGKIRGMRTKLEQERGMSIPLFFASKPLEPFIKEVFGSENIELVEFIDENGKIAHGYNATILPKVCEVWLRANDAKVLQMPQQEPRVKKAEILMRGLAHVGIIALVDEATGYQDVRAKKALSEILEAFVAKELRPWISTFPVEYYKELCRLYGIKYPPIKNNQFPSFFGHITNNAIYERLAPDLLPELKKAVRKQEKKVKLHQFLTEDIGHPKLKEHLMVVVALLQISKNKEEFFQFLDKARPKLNETIPLDL